MAIKKVKPTSPARRYQTFLKREQLTKGAEPEKSLLEPKKRISGRNNDGRITVRRRGGGHKRFYRKIDFKRDKTGIPGKGGQLVRAAGGYAQLVAKEGNYAQLKMPSGEVRKIPVVCMATVGMVGNREHENVSLGKAGRKRWMGRRPKVRGVAMNPVDHPHGGGEGKTSGGRHPVTPWGVPTKGYKTRKNKRTQNMIVRDRRRK